MKRVLIAFVVLALALAGLLTWRIRVQAEAEGGPPSGSGVLEGEGVDVAARLGARVLEVVEEGATVEPGGLLVALNCDEPEARLAEAEARLRSARAQAQGAAAQITVAARQRAASAASARAQRAEIASLEADRDVAAREAGRFEAMGEHATESRRDQARSTVTRLRARTRAARAQSAASREQTAAADATASAARASAEAAQAEIAVAEAGLRSARLQVAECRILAPVAGVVERVYYDAGELAVPGGVVARVVQPAYVRATFYLRNAQVEEAQVGRRAEVEVDALPGRTFVARVRRVGLEAEFTPRNIQTRSDRDRLVFPVEVRIANPDGILRAGMPVTVTLLDGAR